MELIDDLNTCVDEKYFEKRFLEELKIEGYRINKMLNGYIGYLKKRKNEDFSKPSKLNQPVILINSSSNFRLHYFRKSKAYFQL